MDTVTTDAMGNFAFNLLPGNKIYKVHPIFPPGWFPINAIPGVNTLNGDSGEVSTSTRVDDMTLDVFVKNGTINSDNLFIVASPADTVKYRTATYRDWADAKDQKGKRKAIKCKPDKVDFCFSVVTDSPRTGAIEVTFSQPVDVNSFSITPAFGSGGTLDLAGKKWAWGWVGSINDPGLDAGGDCHYLW